MSLPPLVGNGPTVVSLAGRKRVAAHAATVAGLVPSEGAGKPSNPFADPRPTHCRIERRHGHAFTLGDYLEGIRLGHAPQYDPYDGEGC